MEINTRMKKYHHYLTLLSLFMLLGILSDVFIKEGESVVVGACMAMIEATEEIGRAHV